MSLPSLSRCFLTVALGIATLALALTPLAGQSAAGKKYALLVGVRDYDSDKFTPLRFTENDAEGMAGALRDTAGFASVRVLTTTRGRKTSADAPTSANLRRELKA